MLVSVAEQSMKGMYRVVGHSLDRRKPDGVLTEQVSRRVDDAFDSDFAFRNSGLLVRVPNPRNVGLWLRNDSCRNLVCNDVSSKEDRKTNYSHANHPTLHNWHRP